MIRFAAVLLIPVVVCASLGLPLHDEIDHSIEEMTVTLAATRPWLANQPALLCYAEHPLVCYARMALPGQLVIEGGQSSGKARYVLLITGKSAPPPPAPQGTKPVWQGQTTAYLLGLYDTLTTDTLVHHLPSFR